MRNYPKESIKYDDFINVVQNGDLLFTRASNNTMSRLHAFALGTPVAHIGIALVFNSKVFIFESGAPRGAQLRDLSDYMQDGAERLWWRKLKADELQREKIVAQIQKLSMTYYNWNFLKRLPNEILGFDIPGSGECDDDLFSSNCGDLIAKVFQRSGFLENTNKCWFPMHFLEYISFLENPINVIVPK